MMHSIFKHRTLAALSIATLTALPGTAAPSGNSQNSSPVSHATLKATLQAVVTAGGNGGFGLNMWATVVDRDGKVVAVAFSGEDRGDQWPGSRVISAQKANTANAFSLPNFALSTANLYSAVQPGGTLFGLPHSNPVDPETAYKGPAANFGQPNDPLVGKTMGGVNVFGGGLALYDASGKLIGAIGVSGDTSCTDHIIAWKIRHTLNLDNVPAGPVVGTDNIVFDITEDANGHPKSASGWGHPDCDAAATAIGTNLTVSHPVGPNP
jgi:uncharacterized protein GlcG (DUF336 family)